MYLFHINIIAVIEQMNCLKQTQDKIATIWKCSLTAAFSQFSYSTVKIFHLCCGWILAVLDVFWTPYVRSIYVLCLLGSLQGFSWTYLISADQFLKFGLYRTSRNHCAFPFFSSLCYTFIYFCVVYIFYISVSLLPLRDRDSKAKRRYSSINYIYKYYLMTSFC